MSKRASTLIKHERAELFQKLEAQTRRLKFRFLLQVETPGVSIYFLCTPLISHTHRRSVLHRPPHEPTQCCLKHVLYACYYSIFEEYAPGEMNQSLQSGVLSYRLFKSTLSATGYTQYSSSKNILSALNSWLIVPSSITLLRSSK